jgi:hypothetical protein
MGVEEAIKLNCSTIFLLPGIGFQRRQLLKYGFIAAYIDDKNHEPHYEDAVYLLFRPADMDSFQVFLDERYEKGVGVIEDYDYGKGYVVVVYKFPQEYAEEYKLFLEGKYSKFREKYKNLFPTKIEVLEDDGSRRMQFSLPFLIFSKAKSLKEFWEEKIGTELEEDAEYWMVPDLDSKEVLDISEFYHKL